MQREGTKPMNKRAKQLKPLVQGSFYVVDPYAVADAIVRRATIRRTVPELAFRSEGGGRVRSFRLSGMLRARPSSR
jgi:hypothetical protein